MNRRRTWLTRSLFLACVPVLGLFLVAGQAGASAAHAHSPQNVRAAALAALKHLLIGHHSTNQPAGPAGPGLNQVKSTNWSGYVDLSTTFSKISGKWVEPAVSCTSTTALAAFWVGIDGYSSPTVEQDGTLAYCSGGSASYYTWWEMYPTNAVQIVGSTVVPGDAITASVVHTTTGGYALKVTDATNPANSFSTTQACGSTPCQDSSAEWIAEAPTGSSGIFPLPNFGKWRLTHATVTGGTTSGVISTFSHEAITMINGSGAVKAKPGLLNSTGNAFTVTWKRSS